MQRQQSQAVSIKMLVEQF